MNIRKLSLIASVLMVTAFSCLPAQANFRPSDIYKQYLARLYYARHFKDIAPYIMRRTREQDLTLGADDQARRLKWWKRGYVAKFQLIKEEIVPSEGNVNTSYAFIKGKGIGWDKGRAIPCEVIAVMIMEDGGWKVQHTAWTGLTSVK
jgi:hypothetical protein